MSREWQKISFFDQAVVNVLLGKNGKLLKLRQNGLNNEEDKNINCCRKIPFSFDANEEVCKPDFYPNYSRSLVIF